MDKKGIKLKSGKSGHFISFPIFLLPPQKPEFASHVLPLHFCGVFCHFQFYSLLFTVEKQENRANGKPAILYSSQFRKPSIWKCILQKPYKDQSFF